MGFTDEDYRQLKYNNIEFHKGDALFARDKIIRMAGNSIPVKLLEGIFYQILQIDKMLKEYPMNLPEDHPKIDVDYSKIIRSYGFKKGIRSRVNEGDVVPANATVVYPKYKTAIYVSRCHSGYLKSDPECNLCKHNYWNLRKLPYLSTNLPSIHFRHHNI